MVNKYKTRFVISLILTIVFTVLVFTPLHYTLIWVNVSAIFVATGFLVLTVAAFDRMMD